MLPGPPKECLGLFENTVLPQLIQKYSPRNHNKLKWYLLGAVESDIAADVEEAVKNYSVITGYRIAYPYLEVKITTKTGNELSGITPALQMSGCKMRSRLLHEEKFAREKNSLRIMRCGKQMKNIFLHGFVIAAQKAAAKG